LRIGLDATYSIDKNPTGVAVYSREILSGLAAARPAEQWEWFYRSRRYWEARKTELPGRVKARLLADWIGNRSADLFHGLNQRLPRRGFRRQIATFHDLFVLSAEYSTPEFRRRFAAQAREAAAGADLIIAVSAFTGRQVEEHLGVPKSRIRVIHHGATPRVLPQRTREKIVFCVGAIQKRKNQAALVRAFRALPSDWRLVLGGASGYGADETMSEIEKSPCAGRIAVTGYLSESELSEWYARAAVFAFPSFDEGFGIPVLEAMAAGLPVVTGNRSALPEIAGGAAMLVDPADSEAIADALLQLAVDEGLRARYSEQGKRQAAKFGWPAAVRSTLAVYGEILG